MDSLCWFWMYCSTHSTNSTPVFSVVRVARSFVFCVIFCTSLFVLFLLAITLSVLLQFTASDHRRMGHEFRFLLPPLFSTTPLFQNFHNHSFFKIFIIIRFSSFDKYQWTQNTRIIHDVWRLLILSNE